MPIQVGDAVYVFPAQIEQRVAHVCAVPAVLVPMDERRSLWQTVIVVNDKLHPSSTVSDTAPCV